MAELFYPQLSSGALAQYPIRRAAVTRPVANVLPDGTTIALPDPGASRLFWQLAYTELELADLQAIQAHFTGCAGPLRAFTFIDPTGNMLSSTSDLTQGPWLAGPSIQITGGLPDPNGGSQAFSVVNAAQAVEELTQTLTVPSNYQYCFSIYVNCSAASAISLTRRGATVSATDSISISPGWTRISSSGKLNDPGTQLTIAVELAPGQRLQLFGPQLEPQIAPSRYRANAQSGCVYPQSHWASNQLAVTAEAPNLYAVVVSIETAL
jgi:hypothetical protein